MKKHIHKEEEVFLLSLMTAAKLDMEEAGYSPSKMAELIGYTYSKLQNGLSPSVGNSGLVSNEFLKFLKLTKAKNVMQALGRELNHQCIPLILNLEKANKALDQLVSIFAGSGDVSKEAMLAYKDGKLTKKERESLQKKIEKVIGAWQVMQLMINKDYKNSQTEHSTAKTTTD